MIPIAGYADRWSVGHNETIEFKVSNELNEPYSVRLVRMTCADPNPDGPGIIEYNLNSVFSGQFPSRKQPAKLGSYGFVAVDCNRETDFECKVPDNFRSAMYPMRIEC